MEQGAPAIIRFLTQLATRFGVNVSQKVAAQAVPVIGAAGGVVITTFGEPATAGGVEND